MKLTADQALTRLTSHDHAILCTIHAERGVDALPVAYAVAQGFVAIPIDTVKPKAPGRLQRERNLEADPRATLLAEHWDGDDWSRLWWVRTELRWEPHVVPDRAEALANLLAHRYPQYRDKPFARLLVLRIVDLTGWSAIPG